MPVAIVAVPLAMYALRESTGRTQPLDLPGVALAGLGVFLAVWGIVHGNDDGWGSLGVVASLVGSAVALALFVLREMKTSHPVMPLRLFPLTQLLDGERHRLDLLDRNLRGGVPCSRSTSRS